MNSLRVYGSVPVVRSFGRAGRRRAIAKQSFRPSQRPDRLLDAGNEGVVVLTGLRRQRVAEGDAGGMPAGGPAKTREDFIEAVDIGRHDWYCGVDGENGGAFLEGADIAGPR